MSEYKLYLEGQALCLKGNDGSYQTLDKPWELPSLNNVEKLCVDSVLQVMTSMEADLAVSNYFKSLPLFSKLTVSVPNMGYYLKLWANADWDEVTLKDADSIARKAFAGVFGTQALGNPRNDNYSEIDYTVFKSGYTEDRLRLLLERAGFTNVEFIGTETHLLQAVGEKTMLRGERQIGTRLENIRQDHLKRYEFAVNYLKPKKPEKILDCACGIGYGSKMLSDSLSTHVVGVDIHEGAIKHANKYFSSSGTEYVLKDARQLSFEACSFNSVVSFETIEHVDFDLELLASFYRWLKPGGKLICSTPNQDVMPFEKHRFPYHLKHYTERELTKILTSVGFNSVEFYRQDNAISAPVLQGKGGCFIIAVATK